MLSLIVTILNCCCYCHLPALRMSTARDMRSCSLNSRLSVGISVKKSFIIDWSYGICATVGGGIDGFRSFFVRDNFRDLATSTSSLISSLVMSLNTPSSKASILFFCVCETDGQAEQGELFVTLSVTELCIDVSVELFWVFKAVFCSVLLPVFVLLKLDVILCTIAACSKLRLLLLCDPGKFVRNSTLLLL